MASIHKQEGKPNWFCAFTGPDGVRRFKSTGTSDKKAAQEICRTWAEASLHGDSLTPDKAREIISRGVETIMLATGQVLPTSSIGDWISQWLESKKLETSPATQDRYEATMQAFQTFLGSRVNRQVATLHAADILKFRDRCAKTLSVAYVNVHLKIVRVCLSSAVRLGLLTKNPASSVPVLKEQGESVRRQMRLPEIKTVLETCGDTPWRGLVLLGFYTGQRLGDLARLRWSQIDLPQKKISFVTQKTGKAVSMAIATPLFNYLTALPSVDDPQAPVFPEFAAMADIRVSMLSNKFADEVLIPAGLMPPRPKSHVSTGKGRTGKRQVNPITFHSLRHSFTTMLKATGASNAMAQLIVGHDSPTVSANYTHLSHEDTVEPIGRLPDVTK